MKLKNKGFSLAEMLIVFLLVSIMLAAFAPVMTKRTKKSSDPNCIAGEKKMEVLYPISGSYSFEAPDRITGEATITLVGAGGAGGETTNVTIGTEGETNGKIISATPGAGGGGGEYIQFKSTLIAGKEYKIKVGGLGTSPFTKDTSFSLETSINVIATGGNDASGTTAGTGGTGTTETGANDITRISGASGNGATGGTNSAFGTSSSIIGGQAGAVCMDGTNCIPHGGMGSSYETNGASSTGFVAGFGGGGGGYSTGAGIAGVGGAGGSGFAKIEYSVRCE